MIAAVVYLGKRKQKRLFFHIFVFPPFSSFPIGKPVPEVHVSLHSYENRPVGPHYHTLKVQGRKATCAVSVHENTRSESHRQPRRASSGKKTVPRGEDISVGPVCIRWTSG